MNIWLLIFMSVKIEIDQTTNSQSPSGLRTSIKSQERNEDNIVENWVVLPPDGGWGWVVIFGAFMCNFITDGCMYSFGMFLEEISTDLKVSPTEVATASSIMCGFYFLLGPISCALMNRFGFRLIGIIGGLLSATSFVVASLVNSLTWFLIILGVIGGIGFNMIFTPSFVVVGFYFERWRALATSIAVCGSSIGMIVFPIIITNFLTSFTWRIKFNMIGGLMLMCSLISFVFKPLESSRVYTECEKKVQFLAERDSIGSFHIETSGHKIHALIKRFHLLIFPSKQEDNPSMISSIEKKTSITNSYLLGATGASVSSVATKSILKSMTSERLYTVIEEEEYDNSAKYKCFKFKTQMRAIWDKLTCHVFNPFSNPASRPMYREDIFYTGSLNYVPQYSKTVLPGTSSKKSAIDYHVSVTKVATERSSNQKHFRWIPVSVRAALRKMLDYTLFKNISFNFLLMSGVMSLMGNYIPFVFSEWRAIEKGMDSAMTFYILSTIGVANTFGRIACGIISSFPKIDALTITYSTTIICGLMTIASNYFYTLTMQLVYGAVFGFTMASLAALKSVILVDLLGLDKLTNAFGLLILFQGMASFLGVPIGGLLKTVTGSYDLTFWFSGICICCSGILLIPIQKFKKNIVESPPEPELPSKLTAVTKEGIEFDLKPLTEKIKAEMNELKEIAEAASIAKVNK